MDVHDQPGTGISFDIAVDADIETIEEDKYCNADEEASQLRNDYRFFKLTRIKELEMLSETFTQDFTPTRFTGKFICPSRFARQ